MNEERCHVGRESDVPCPREATTRNPVLGVMLCREHGQAVEAGGYVADWEWAEEVTRGWLSTACSSRCDALERLAEKAHAEAKQNLALAEAKLKRARAIAAYK